MTIAFVVLADSAAVQISEMEHIVWVDSAYEEQPLCGCTALLLFTAGYARGFTRGILLHSASLSVPDGYCFLFLLFEEIINRTAIDYIDMVCRQFFLQAVERAIESTWRSCLRVRVGHSNQEIQIRILVDQRI